MQITILAIGSRGDVQPCIALGCGLQSAGHRVRLASHVPFEGFIRARGLDFSPIAGDPLAVFRDPRPDNGLCLGATPPLHPPYLAFGARSPWPDAVLLAACLRRSHWATPRISDALPGTRNT